MKKNRILKIIFNLKGRTHFCERYLKLLNYFQPNSLNLDLLIINEKGNQKIKTKTNINFISSYSKNKIDGMNGIFKEIYLNKNLILKYKYCCFVEDDNFIFPKSIILSKNFLENNSDYISCSGKSFLISKSKNLKLVYLKQYTSPNSNYFDDIKNRFQKYNGSLCYYSLFRSKIFVKILSFINKINDDNLSEVFFNYLTILSGKLKLLDSIYLVREFPRPKIYNIPTKEDWVKNDYLFKDLNFIINTIQSKKSQNLLEDSIFKYLAIRFKKEKQIFFFKFLNKLKDKTFYLKYHRNIKNYLFIINQI